MASERQARRYHGAMDSEATNQPAPNEPASPTTGGRRLLGEVLQEKGLVTGEVMRRALVLQRGRRKFLGEVLLEMGAVTPGDLRRVLSDELGVPTVDLSVSYGDPMILETVPKTVAFDLQVIPLFVVGNQLTVAMADPNNLAKLDELRFLTGKEVLPVLAFEAEIRRHLVEYYGELDADGEGIGLEFEQEAAAADSRAVGLEDAETERPIVRLVNLILMRAIQEEASDIHLEPQEKDMSVRYRIDGRLQAKPFSIPRSAVSAVVSRVKILSRLDISEKRVPQDGKLRLRYRDRRIDVRTSTYPTIHGEKVVMRLLDKERQNFELATIGMSEGLLSGWKRLLSRHEGIVLVTGPTGSGKSSTLYATLRHLNQPEVNIVTLEDPVEYELRGVAQAQVNDRAGFTFAAGLRSILRQDPDVILVGEIRDTETAQIAVQAALTGHLVLATLHTNDAASTVTRLVDMGLPRYLVASSVIGVLAQRLVRRLCPACRAVADPTETEFALIGHLLRKGVPFLDGAGCEQCRGAGYRGRLGVHELMVVDSEARRLITNGASDRQLVELAQTRGFRELWLDGVEKVQRGATSLRELLRSITPATEHREVADLSQSPESAGPAPAESAGEHAEPGRA
jgi:type IV pilus assembly protein PilB